MPNELTPAQLAEKQLMVERVARAAFDDSAKKMRDSLIEAGRTPDTFRIITWDEAGPGIQSLWCVEVEKQLNRAAIEAANDPAPPISH